MSSTTQKTRRISYDQILSKRETREKQIKSVLDHASLTASELAINLYAAGITKSNHRSTVAPRLTEMEQAGVLIVVGERECKTTGRPEAVYTSCERAQQLSIFDYATPEFAQKVMEE